jgi:PAS domain S-box-containing protein
MISAHLPDELVSDGARSDVLSMNEALRTVSDRIELDELIEALTQVALDRAGARRGALLLVRNGELSLAAEAHSEQDGIHVRLLGKDAAAPRLPAALFNAVRRTREPAYLSDARQASLFASDDYFKQIQPKSVACLPILRQGELLGLLYLENSQVAHAFSSRRSALELLVSHAAICLDRAQLYAQLSERKGVEDALRKSEQLWRAVFEHNPTMYFILDENGTVVAVNPTGATQLGYTVEELVGHSVLILFEERNWEIVRRSIAACLEQRGQTRILETQKIRKDGTLLWVRETAKAMPTLIEHAIVLVSCEDITERKVAQDELRRSEAFLAEGQEISRTGSWGWHVPSGKLVWSKEHYRIFGFEPDEMAPTFALFLSRICPGDRPLVQQALDEAIRDKKEFNFEFRILLPDGTVKYLQGIGRPVARPSGEIDEFIGTTMDITERKLAEAALRKAHEELERRVRERTSELQQSNQQLVSEVAERTRAEEVLALRSQELAHSNAELEQMAYVASHDLQEPLRMVASYLQLLEQRYRGRLDSEANEFIGFAVDGAKRMQTLIDDLLVYSRVGSRAKPLVPTASAAALATALHSLRVAIQESGAQIESAALPMVMGDAAQLTQLFQNLVGNAIKFRGEEAPRITIWAEPDNDFWRFAVQDNGIGIAQEYFDRIFVMFQRLHSRSKYPGTGIGLTICKKIVERHGGRIWVEAAAHGSLFKFTLPKVNGASHE